MIYIVSSCDLTSLDPMQSLKAISKLVCGVSSLGRSHHDDHHDDHHHDHHHGDHHPNGRIAFV